MIQRSVYMTRLNRGKIGLSLALSNTFMTQGASVFHAVKTTRMSGVAN
jgi:hypothetical protein